MARRRGAREGTIYRRRDGTWEAKVSLGYRNGRRARKSFYGATRREVQLALRLAQHDIDRGVAPVSDQRQALTTYLQGWLAAAQPSLRDSTFVSYAGHVRLHIVPALGRLRLAEITPQHVRELLAAKLAAGLSPRSVQYTHAVLRRALGQAVRDGLLARNVAQLVEAPRVRRAEIKPFSPEQARTFLQAAAGDRLEALYTVAVALGLRQGEALGLRWLDIDLDAGTLRVAHTLQRRPKMLRGADDRGRGTRYVLAEPKTSRSRRTMTMPGLVIRALRTHRARQLQERLLAGPRRWQGDEWGLVFTSARGTPLDARNVSHRFEALLQRAGLPRSRFHDLRHSAATLMLAQGVDARTIMETLGHSQIGVTMNVYAHVLPSLQRDAADRMDVILGGAIGQ